MMSSPELSLHVFGHLHFEDKTKLYQLFNSKYIKLSSYPDYHDLIEYATKYTSDYGNNGIMEIILCDQNLNVTIRNNCIFDWALESVIHYTCEIGEKFILNFLNNFELLNTLEEEQCYKLKKNFFDNDHDILYIGKFLLFVNLAYDDNDHLCYQINKDIFDKHFYYPIEEKLKIIQDDDTEYYQIDAQIFDKYIQNILEEPE